MTRAIVYLPGLEGTGRLIEQHEPALAERGSILKIPWRTLPPYDAADLVADTVATLDRKGLDRVCLLADSFGGVVALNLALSHPERLERLILVNSFAYYPKRGLLRFGRALSRMPRWFVQAVRIGFDTPLLAHEGVPRDARRRFFAAAASQPHAAYRERIRIIARHDLRDRIGRIAVPTLVVSSMHDRVVPPAVSRGLAEMIPGARLRVLPEAGHAALLTPGVSLADLVDEVYSLS